MAGISLKIRTLQQRLRALLSGPQTFAFLPALTLGGYWFGGEGVLLFLALAFPAAFAIAGLFSGTGPAWSAARDRETELHLRGSAEKAICEILATENSTGKTTAAIAIALDDFDTLERQYGTKAASTIMKQTAGRLITTLREADKVVRLDGSRFGIVLGPVRRADLETLIQLSARLQAAIAEPFSIDATRVFVTISVGFCLSGRASVASGGSLLEFAERALEIAQINGSGSIRSYSPESNRRVKVQSELRREISTALDTGQIIPWFQPQISTRTGEITGFEALARWEHPDRGIILPGDFLPAINELDLQERLSEIILSGSLSALRKWDKSGFNIPNVAVNFASEDLSNPKLCEKICWELDRYELTPERLCVEILENVVADSQDDMIVRSIQRLVEMGCKMDLDDFGTGHASIANIRRFAVHRIKIDRSFITRIDRDIEQKNMVAAILTMADRLQIESLAEGVETIEEHATLTQLGCGHVQGFSIAKPMPYAKTEAWISLFYSKQTDATKIGQKAS